MSVAGHDFSGLHGRCSCGLSLADVSGVQPQHIGHPGWAHYGNLVEREYHEIRAVVEAMWCETMAVASGMGIGGMAAGSELENL